MEPIQPSLAEVAALVGNPARANMLTALLDGRALTATELAFAGGVAPQTASGHLARLTEGRLLTLAKQGRHAYYRLASPMIGRMLESIMAVAADGPPRYQPRWRGGDALRNARTCYDHLAGRLGVGLADALVERDHVALSEDGGIVTRGGRGILTRLRHRAARRGWNAAGILPAVPRLERAPHASRRRPRAPRSRRAVSSSAGSARIRDTRAVLVTEKGKHGFSETFGIALAA